MTTKQKVNIAVLASGRGTNFEAILKAIKNGRLKAQIAILICDKKNAPVIKKARKADIKTLLIVRENYPCREEFENEIIRNLGRNIDLIVLAGFMRMFSPGFIRRFKNRVINIHPSLLPSFKGRDGIKDAFDYGAKITGVTVHFVDEKMDHGPIILQEAICIEENDTLKTLEEKIHKAEHRIYPKAIQLYIEKKLKIYGRKVKRSA